ncbi:hypothetical protein KC19_3G126400 [Ceratodon purpureus]|uniref:Uncharacterized protein n=1 Tax=Ceratodon purpureus TaxID=3225 RepID=A0A8T0IKB9_CERPU|nr:hypothetical protein KC19_3G126400 [Ceratodon purpureus]
MSDDEQSPGGRSLRMGKKKRDGPNWFMIAGGAVVMAVSVAFGRKKILSEGDKTKERAPNGGAWSQAASHDDDDTGSVHTYETVHNGTPFWDKPESGAQSHAEFEFHSFKTKRPAPNDPSPQVSKFCRQLSHNSVCQSNEDPVQSDSQTSTALRAGLTARREMVHRLRQQIRSRDAMIYDMQTQLADQEQMINMHRNHSADLQECVQAVNAKLFEANLEVQRLHRELMAQRAQPIADLDEECIDIAVAEIKRKWVHPKDFEEIILQARRLNEEVERLEREKEVKDNLAQAKSRQCELLSSKVSSLANELEEIKTAAYGKQRLLEAKEQENLKLASVLQDLQHKLEIESRDNEWARSSKLIRRADTLNMNSSWKLNHNVDRPVTPPNYEEVSSTYVGDGHNNYHQAGSFSLGKACSSVHARNDSQQDSEDSVAKAESRCLSDGHTKRSELPTEQDDAKIDEDLILKFENEVDQVASGLSATSKVVSEKMQAATQVLMKFQEHCEYRTDVQSNVKEFNFSQAFYCLSESMSPEQRQDLRNELEQATKQQDLDREMKGLTRHQTKLEELKHAVAKLSARFNAQNPEFDTSNTEVLQLASSLSDIEQRIAVQENIVTETSLFVKQLSTLFQVPSPQSPPIQEVWRTVKETSGKTSSSNRHHKQSVGSSDENSRNALQSRVEEKVSRILERQDSSSASRQYSSPSRNNSDRPSSSPVKLLDKPYEFQLGASDGPVSISRTRNRNPFGAARTSFRKPATSHESMVGSKRQSICVGESSEQNSRNRGSFRPDSEVTSGFSFGLSARDRPLDNVSSSTSGDYRSQQTAEPGMQQLEAIVETAQQYEQEQGDRMSSPEPEPSTHIFRTTPSFNTSELSVSNPTFSKRFRTQSGSESSSPANLSSMQSPAYDVSRCSPVSGRFGSPQSPCFGVTRDETNSRRSLSLKTSSPLAASSNSRLDIDVTTADLRKLNFTHSTDEDTDFQIKRSTEDNSSRTSYDSNTDCSPRLSVVNSAHPSGAPVGVSPFAARMAYLDVRQPGSPVGSLRNFGMRSERDHGFPSNEVENEDDEEVSHQSIHTLG